MYIAYVLHPNYNASTGKWTLTIRTSDGHIHLYEYLSEYDAQLAHSLALIESAWYHRLRDSNPKSPSTSTPFAMPAVGVNLLLAKALLHDPKLVPVLALHYFAGLSISEIIQMGPQHIDIDQQILHIPDKKAGSSTRVVTDLPTTVWPWLAPWQHTNSTLIIVKSNLRLRINRINEIAFRKKPITPNGRLSFAIFGYILSESIEAVSRWLDIPPQLLPALQKFKSSPLKPKAEEYFTLTPPKGYHDFVISLNDEVEISNTWPEDDRLQTLVWRMPLNSLAKLLGVPIQLLKLRCLKRGIRLPSS